ncbi:CoA transferase [Haloglomus litoreum]|uniref:CoA transferase n=1 Tax=Haloglomus litoreum TaxID=3034026 RepID=UPI0023E7D686|nr:CoA transferase [Haloglomus sp. DT116]
MSSLTGVRVLDMTRVLGGPYCTMLLADMGADVVKVEPPGGDLVRDVPPFLGEDDPYGGYFQSINRGKRSLELDLQSDADREAFLDLVDRADVLVENFRAGTMTSLGLGYERLRERNPGLVYAAIRGFGDPRTGATARQEMPAYDLIVQALSGVMQVNGQPDDPPTKVGLGIGDIFTGALSAVGILGALHHRERTGEGQFVDTAMYDSMISLCERTVYQHSYTGEVPGRRGNAHPTLFPYDGFETVDGQVVIAAIGDNHWSALCDAIGRPEWTATYPDSQARLAARDRIRPVIADWTRSRTSEQVCGALGSDVPCAPVRDVAEVFADRMVHDREMLHEVTQPGSDRRVQVAGSPIKMTETPPAPGERAPVLDEHREEVGPWTEGSMPDGAATDPTTGSRGESPAVGGGNPAAGDQGGAVDDRVGGGED